MSTSTRKIVAGLLGFAMVLTIVVGLSSTASAAFTRSLTVGLSGADVTELQTALVAQGYLTMPAGVSMGYFGSLTKRAVAAWQAASGVSPALGYFGPKSQAAWTGGGGGMSTVPGCTSTSGYSPLTGMSCAGAGSLVPGCTSTSGYSPLSGMSCAGPSPLPGPTGTWTPDGTDGSITVSYNSYAPSSQTLKKGDMNKPLISVKLQAVNGKTAITRFDVHFSERPWLDFGSLSLTDSSGNILGTKTLSSASDVTEITVGSDYLVRFDSITPIVVTPGTDIIVAVTGNVLAASDKITGQSVYVGIGSGAIRTINGKGYTDSVGLSSGSGSGVTSTTGNTVVLSSTGSTGSLYTRISPVTPAQQIVVTSNSQTLYNQVLGVFSVKSQNQHSTLNSVQINIKTATATASYATSSLVSNLRLSSGNLTYSANSLSGGGGNDFTSLAIPLPADTWVDLIVTGDIASGYQSNNISASTTLIAASLVGIDSNYNTVTITSASNQTSNDLQFLQAGLRVSNISTVHDSSPTLGYGSTLPGTVYGTTFKFTLTNTGSTDVYVSRLPGALFATTSDKNGTLIDGALATSSRLTNITAVPGTGEVAGDGVSASAFAIPSGGGSRDFIVTGLIQNSGGSGNQITLTATGIYFNTTAASVTATSTANVIGFGLSNLKTTAIF